ncbi:poly-beta-1,6-N-acetyl-D-glucosamine biosynthesis protein PgaD [Yersinia intermedia]|jgi:biofilm PGA synthesis protein PgaD|uniref:Poly-beta-1,6-N-acetyl-D-glucosamine biosynthesis protein PgaD n=1 Tax=Yersinia intermedia TaxID=631 RepID=A0A209A9L6_YERIN|nr:poly-beta-1,6-N-acetyl-D-glucosamine biosynthesis protein PgaD [Yersinia intermedia]MCB5311756.1 poly-beta-1,6-N-acetyl-D-glucosamine biosynthesis protein PgaD [Yersinia intermedia]MCB5323853.1 poly-beta-1,6-N-acetyl-D-glucosamine biosynthesis protein PgaD [Yersinia intermedia]MCB5327553.1 poly-beta-1,6-N-acetyl-D-glucosamine biosynthesis protein PgaD [Yersinia intermedia]OVZ89464.1 poly-beta-1,6-N-acetyl-D-glucosamine biosynthesis protein PgaD [Yersinia intermedia]UNK21715.1 poly-beta-1,6-
MSAPLIHTEQRLIPRWIDIIITALAWIGFIFLFVKGFLDIIGREPNMGPIPFRIYIISGLTTLALYLAIAAFNAVVIIIWAKYNQVRFQVERRGHRPHLNDDELASSMELSAEMVAQLKAGSCLTLYNDEHGQLLEVKEGLQLPTVAPVVNLRRG